MGSEELKQGKYFGKLQVASDEEIEALQDAKNQEAGRWQWFLHRVTFRGSPNHRQVLRNRKRNKVARKQRRVNRLRSRRK